MTVGDMLRKLIDMSTHLSYDIGGSYKIQYSEDPKLLRPSDVTLQIPCIDKFVNKTGWKPEIPFDQTLEDTLNFWREYWRKNGQNRFL